MNKMIDKIAQHTYSHYGKNIAFCEYDFKCITVDKTTAFYRVQSSNKSRFKYIIQIYILDKISTYTPNIPIFSSNKCMYCKDKNTEYKMNCCNKCVHLECAMKHNFACCFLKEYLTDAANDSCSVCLEETNTVTECGHHLCCNCLIEICKINNDEKNVFSCPLCRTNVEKEDKGFEYQTVMLDNNEELVYVSIL
jgi:hypothetical protein